MKYCTNCGTEIKGKNKFCTNCGKEIKNEVEKVEAKKVEKKAPKEFNMNYLVLYVGVSLVLLATFIFAICNWENMSGLFKISFLTFEAVLFFIISFVFAKIKNNGLSKAFYMMAVLMIPIILYTIPVYSLLGNYLSYEGAGIFVYLAISNFICASIYLLSYLLLNSKPYTFISYLFIYATIVNIFLAFERKMEFVIISTLIFVLLVIIINFINNKDNFFRKSLTWFTSILFSLFSIFMIFAIPATFGNSYIIGFNSINLYIVLITVLYLVDTFIFIYQNRNSVFKYVSPFVIMPVLFVILVCTIEDMTVFMCIFAPVTLLMYVIYLIYKDKYLKIASKIVTYLILYFLILSSLSASAYDIDHFIALGVVSLFTLGFNLINRFTEKNPVVSDILVPLSSIFVVVGFTKYLVYVPNAFIVLALAAVFAVVYMVLKAVNKKTNIIYYIYTIACAIIAMFMCSSYDSNLYIIGVNALLLIVFIFVSFVEKSKALNIITYIALIISLLGLKILIDIDTRIIFACISLISIVVGIILSVTHKPLNKFYLYFGEILAVLLTFFAFGNSTYAIMAMISVLFVIAFVSICAFNNTTAFRVIAELAGLILIYNLINTLIDVTLFSTIITLFIYMSILVIIGLLGKEKGWVIILLSTACLIPYFDYVGSSNLGITNQLVMLPFIVYLFVITFYAKMKDVARFHTILWPLIIFSAISINTTTIGVIFALVLALAYIFIGIIKKYRYLVSFGIIYIVVIITCELANMFNNLAVIIAVLGVGLSLIIYVVISEVYKSRKNK